ncbi:MAG: hypothetical protein GVY22_02715 [Gammaproteobacteria bacterium]|jgi:hypothetical protein|nr:hypothetical protein [Gammaproteobacteria bacterium]
MKRRIFLQSLGAAGALGFGSGWSSAGATVRRPALQPLTPVFDQLPQAMHEARRRSWAMRASWDAATGAARDTAIVEPDDDAYDGLYPLLIGFGPRAERILDQLHAAGAIAADAGLYRTGRAASQPVSNWLAQRLERTAVVMLVIDPDEPAAREEALQWARQLVDDGVYLSVALVLDSQGEGLDPSWRSALGIPVIEVCVGRCGLDTRTIVRAMLPGVPFNRQGLIGVDLLDVRTVLTTGSRAWTTAVNSPSAEDGPTAIARGFANLPPVRPTGVLAWVNAGCDFGIEEFETLLATIHADADDEALCILAPLIDPDYAENERLISLTLIGH